VSRTAQAAGVIALSPEAALALWTDVDRWATFVEGFAHVVERSPGWPAEGSKLVWQSTPGGRGRVTEKVVEKSTRGFATQVYEDAFRGVQTLKLSEDADGARAELTLDYELTKGGPLHALADVIFIRRALRDALRRTLRRFAVEAGEEASGAPIASPDR
jgi:polyketide cyclase/dehydrase/lipid transport protein